MTRLEANKAILEKLAEIIDKNPDLRFSQILYSFGFVKGDFDIPKWANEFYVESEEILKRINSGGNG